MMPGSASHSVAAGDGRGYGEQTVFVSGEVRASRPPCNAQCGCSGWRFQHAMRVVCPLEAAGLIKWVLQYAEVATRRKRTLQLREDRQGEAKASPSAGRQCMVLGTQELSPRDEWLVTHCYCKRATALEQRLFHPPRLLFACPRGPCLGTTRFPPSILSSSVPAVGTEGETRALPSCLQARTTRGMSCGMSRGRRGSSAWKTWFSQGETHPRLDPGATRLEGNPDSAWQPSAPRPVRFLVGVVRQVADGWLFASVSVVRVPEPGCRLTPDRKEARFGVHERLYKTRSSPPSKSPSIDRRGFWLHGSKLLYVNSDRAPMSSFQQTMPRRSQT